MDNITSEEYGNLVRIEQNLSEVLNYPYSNLLGDDDLEAIEEALKGVTASIEKFLKQPVK